MLIVRSSNLRALLFVVAVALLAGSFGSLAAGMFQEKADSTANHGGNDDRPDYFSASSLVAASQAIVTGRALSSREETYEFPSASTGKSAGVLTIRITTVEVAESLKGSIKPGEVIAVTQSVHSARNSRGETEELIGEPLQLSSEDDHLFFLNPAFFSQFDGPESSTWGRPGEPGFAVMDGQEIRFLASDRYKAKAADRGFTSSSPDGVPFSLTRSELELLVEE